MAHYILANKLDNESKEAWAHATAETDFPSLTDFFKFINKRSDALENFQSLSKNKFNTARPTTSKKVTSMAVQAASLCPMCTGEHYIGMCEKFLGLHNRTKASRRGKKLCFNCLASTHQAKICRSRYKCRICKRRHHLTLHSDGEKETKVIPVESTSFNVLMRPTSSYIRAILPTALVTIVDAEGNYQRCRALLDSGSQSSFISEDCVQRLRLHRKRANISITGITAKTIQSKGRCFLILSSLGASPTQIKIEALKLNHLPSMIPDCHLNREDIPLMQDLPLADPSFNKVAPIDILVGADKFFEILESEQRRIGSTILQKRVFGWVVSGPTKSPNSSIVIDSKGPNNMQRNLSLLTLQTQLDVDIDHTLRQFWEIERQLWEMFYTNTVKRRDDGRYIVKLPFREPVIKLGNSINVATTRLLTLERKLVKDENLRQQYVAQMREEMEHMVEIPQNQLKIKNENSFYLPHHAVIKQSSETTKVRVVFDGSSKSTNGASLNESREWSDRPFNPHYGSYSCDFDATE